MRRRIVIWVIIGVTAAALCIAGNVAFTVYTVQQYAQNECQALVLIHHAGSKNVKFNEAIETWGSRDGCFP